MKEISSPSGFIGKFYQVFKEKLRQTWHQKQNQRLLQDKKSTGQYPL